MFFRALIVFAILLIIDFYVFQGFKLLFPARNDSERNPWHMVYWGVSIAGFLFIILAFATNLSVWPRPFRVYPFAFIAIIYISKLFVVTFLILDDAIRAVRFAYEFMAMKFFPKHESVTSAGSVTDS